MKVKLLLPTIIILSIFLSGCINIPPKPSQIVLAGAVTNQGSTASLQLNDDEGSSTNFKVPADKVLVITNVLIIPIKTGNTKLELSLIQQGGGFSIDRIRQTWFLPATKPRNLDYSPGMKVSSNSTLAIKNASSQPGEVYVSIHGYLAEKN